MSAEDRNGQVSTDEECTGCTTQERSFDAIARGVANGTVSRRKALRLLAVGLVGSALGFTPREASAEKCKPLGHKCLTNIDCCSRFCDKNGNKCACTPDEIACQDPSSGQLRCVPRCASGLGPCKIDACDPATGQCVVANADGALCEDGDLCTVGDQCQNGTCQPGPVTVCEQCFRCEPTTGLCEVDVNQVGKTCNDNDPCTVNDACTALGACVGTPKDCDDNDDCTTDLCNPTTGACEHTPLTGTPCDDNNPCTTGDICNNGQCVGEAVNCAQCLKCNPSDGICEADPDQIGDSCNDNNPCTENDQCTATGTCVGTPKVCPTGQICVSGTCQCPAGTCGTNCTGTTCGTGTSATCCSSSQTCCVHPTTGTATCCNSNQTCCALGRDVGTCRRTCRA